MNVPFVFEFVIGVAIGLVSITIVILLSQLRGQKRYDRLSQPAYEYMQHEAQEEAKSILDEAKAAAAHIEDEATNKRNAMLQSFRDELTDIKNSYKDTLQAAAQEQGAALTAVHKTHASDLSTQTTAALTSIQAVVEPIRSEVSELQAALTATESAIKQTADSAKESLSTTVEEVTAAVRAALLDEQNSIQAELQSHSKAALQAVDTATAEYKQAREQIVDMHITQIVEAVTKRVLQAELTVSEHAELAKAALEKAKTNGTIT